MIVAFGISFMMGFLTPLISSRFGKVLPADPGTICANLMHKPHFPKASPVRALKLRRKWAKFMAWATFLGCCFVGLTAAAQLFLPPDLWVWFLLFFFFVTLGILADAEYCLLPDCVTIPLLLCGFGASVYGGLLPPEDAVQGAFFGYLISLASVVCMRMRRPAVFGAGDVKFLTALGAWGGAYGLNYILLLSFVFFATQAFLKKESSGPFGPSLGLASILILFYLYVQ